VAKREVRVTFDEFIRAVSERLQPDGITKKTIQVSVDVWQAANGFAVLVQRPNDAEHVNLGFAGHQLSIVVRPSDAEVINIDEDGTERAASEIRRRLKP
jgi:hypothetical protein